MISPGPASAAPVPPGPLPSPPTAELAALTASEQALLDQIGAQIQTQLTQAAVTVNDCGQALYSSAASALAMVVGAHEALTQQLETALLGAIGSAYQRANLLNCPIPGEEDILAAIVQAEPLFPSLALPGAQPPVVPMPVVPPLVPTASGGVAGGAPNTPAAVSPVTLSPVSVGSATVSAVNPDGSPALSPGTCPGPDAVWANNEGTIPPGTPESAFISRWVSPDLAGYDAATLSRAPQPQANALFYLPAGWLATLQATPGPLVWACAGYPGAKYLVLVPGGTPPPPPPPAGNGSGTGNGALPAGGGQGQPCPPPIINCPAPVVNVAAPQVTVNVVGPAPSTNGTGAGTDQADAGQLPPAPPADGTSLLDQAEGTGAGGTLRGGARPLGPDWSSPDVCKTIDTAVAGFGPLDTSAGFAGVFQSLTSQTADSLHDFLTGNLTGLADAVWKPVSAVLSTGLAWLGRTLGADLTPGGCTSPALLTPVLARAGLALAERWLDLGLGDVRRQFEYQANYICPTTIPSVPAADRCWLAGTIGDDLWRCWVRANNTYEGPEKKVVEAMRTRPTYRDLNTLYKRGKISIVQWQTAIRGEGVIQDEERDRLALVDNVWPSPPAVFAVAGRGAFDAGALARYGYGEGQATSLGEAGAKLLTGGDLDDQWASPAWVAHWQLPSVTEAVEMWRRLADPSVGGSLQTTEADLDHVLAAHQVPPFWARRIKAVAVKLPSKRELKELFLAGIIDAGAAQLTLRQGGVDAIMAANETTLWGIQRRDKWASSKWGKWYMEGAINAADFKKVLSQGGMDAASQDDIITYLRNERKAMSRDACIKATQRRYEVGDSNTVDAQQRLVTYGLDMDQSVDLVTEWSCQLAAKSKSASAAELCSWANAGIITPAEQLQRLQALGYSPVDGARIVKLCGAQQAARLAKAKAQADAAAARAQAAVLKAQQQAQVAMGKATSAAQRAQQTAQKQQAARLKRAQRITSAAIAQLGLAQADAAQLVAAEVAQLEQAGGLTSDEALALLDQVVKQQKALKVADWRPALQLAATELQELKAVPAVAAGP